VVSPPLAIQVCYDARGERGSGLMWRNDFRGAAREWVALTGIVVVAACATPEVTENIGPDYVLSEASGRGLAIGSIALVNPFPSFAVLRYRKIGSGDEGYFQPDRSNLVAAELPAGDYELYAWRVAVEDGSIISAKPFRIAFRIVPGKAVYLGSYDVRLEHEALGLTPTSSSVINSQWVVDVSCTNQSERDLRTFAARHRALPRLEISPIDPQACHENLGEGSRYYAQKLRLGADIGL
jgi:hypothetical protein